MQVITRIVYGHTGIVERRLINVPLYVKLPRWIPLGVEITLVEFVSYMYFVGQLWF
jgi:hypothetical protein